MLGTAAVAELPSYALSWDVIQWRLDELQRAGYPILSALRLAEDSHIDLHLACDLLARGCPPQEALRILL